MKKRLTKFAMYLFVVMLWVGIAFAAMDYYRTSDVKTASALIYTGDSYFHGIVLTMNGIDPVYLAVYDGVTATGAAVIATITIPSSATVRNWNLQLNKGVQCLTGIYVSVTGTTAYTAYFSY